MRIKFAALAFAATMAVATPAHAEGPRVEARGGIAWANGAEEAIAGVAVGYDFAEGEDAFLGLEVSADKILVDGADPVFGITGRGGWNLTDQLNVFIGGGYSIGEGNTDAVHAGGGIEFNVTEKVYLKTEYRRFFDVVDVNTVAAGVGFRF